MSGKRTERSWRKYIEKNNEYVFTLVYILSFAIMMLAIIAFIEMFFQYKMLAELASIWRVYYE